MTLSTASIKSGRWRTGVRPKFLLCGFTNGPSMFRAAGVKKKLTIKKYWAKTDKEI